MYVTVLHDVDRAIKYCDKVYKSKKEDCDQVIPIKLFYIIFCLASKNNDLQIYVTLLRLLIDPPDSWLAGLGSVTKPAPNLEKVIEILNQNADQIATPDVLKVLPDEIPVHHINNFMVIALEKAISNRRLYQVNRGLLYAKLLKVKYY